MPGRPTSDRSIAFLATYVPRQCGIATFTRDLRDGILASLATPEARAPYLPVVTLDNGRENLGYPAEVIRVVPDGDASAYRSAARLLERRRVDAISIQHEYGIFGGADGEHLMAFLDELRIPAVTTLHTILQRPSPHQREILRELVRRSSRVVVMADRGRQLLETVYGLAPSRRIAVIPHGVPDVPFEPTSRAKLELGLDDRPLLLSFGLLNPNKRIELVLEALARVVGDLPDVRYVVLGATHPEVRRVSGERYREDLLARVRRLGLARYVRFVDRYVAQPELVAWLRASDVFVTAYANAEQVTSGTLAYALAAGKAIVSTPYQHATELLADGRGLLVPFEDAGALAAALRRLLGDPVEREGLRRTAYATGRSMTWPRVGASYMALLEAAAAERAPTVTSGRAWVAVPVGVTGSAMTGSAVAAGAGAAARAASLPPAGPAPAQRALPQPAVPQHALPPVARRHLDEISNAVGVFQHATGRRPDPAHGYCTDDVARALVVDVLQGEAEPAAATAASVRRDLFFLELAFDTESGRFHNFLSTGGRWLDRVGSADAHGRAVQALGEAILRTSDRTVALRARRLFEAALPEALRLGWLRPQAYALLGCDAYLRAAPDEPAARQALDELAHQVASRFEQVNSSWPWPEPVVTYDNGAPVQALLVAAERLARPDWRDLALQSLGWLLAGQHDPDGRLVPVGNRGWWPRGGRPARHDQQPVEALSLLEACRTAFLATRDARWLDAAERAFGWFLGANELGVRVADPELGGCRDGLGIDGLNENMGAESTLAWLLAVERMRALRAAVAAAAGIRVVDRRDRSAAVATPGVDGPRTGSVGLVVPSVERARARPQVLEDLPEVGRRDRD